MAEKENTAATNGLAEMARKLRSGETLAQYVESKSRDGRKGSTFLQFVHGDLKLDPPKSGE